MHLSLTNLIVAIACAILIFLVMLVYLRAARGIKGLFRRRIECFSLS